MKPILFNTHMVQAIQDGRKTVTRRVMNPQPVGQPYRMNNSSVWPGYFSDGGSDRVLRPQYQPGDILYVRETWQFFPCFDCVKSMCDTTPQTYEDSDSVTEGCWIYRADYTESDQKRVCWHPSIHMPKEAARIFLRVKDVRAEKLQDITEAGKTAEGLHDGWQHYNFYELWDSTIKPADRASYGWEANPWVWVIEFERISRKEANNNA